jgi:hypothetical protein
MMVLIIPYSWVLIRIRFGSSKYMSTIVLWDNYPNALLRILSSSEKSFKNKFGRETTICRLSGALVSMNVGMKIIGH